MHWQWRYFIYACILVASSLRGTALASEDMQRKALAKKISANLQKLDVLSETMKMYRREKENDNGTSSKLHSYDLLVAKGNSDASCIYIRWLGWNVIIARCSQDGTIRQVYLFTAKLGYEIRAKDKQKITLLLKKHPGTGMFYGETLYVEYGKPSSQVYTIIKEKRTDQLPVYTAEQQR